MHSEQVGACIQNSVPYHLLYNDEGGNIASMNIDMLYNTVIGTPRDPGQDHMLVHMVNDTMETHAVFYNNIVHQVGELAAADYPSNDNWSVTGGNNWVTEGTETAGLAGTIEGSDPGFVDAAALDFTLTDTPAIPAIQAAAAARFQDLHLQTKSARGNCSCLSSNRKAALNSSARGDA
jgi:hypothetical protein